jgi:hypothetical protein
MKIRSSGAVQGYNFSVDNSVGGKLAECLNDLREAFVEVLAVSRMQDRFTALNTNGAVAVQLDFVGSIGTFGKIRNQSAFHWLYELRVSLRQRS